MRAFRPAFLFLLLTAAWGQDAPPASPDSPAARPSQRGYRSFLPVPGLPSAEPARFVLQMLLDRQPKGDSDSYLLQVVFRGRPAPEFIHRVLPDRVEIDFFDTGRPAMRLARVRGGRLTATSLEELAYRDPGSGASPAAPHRRMVRLTLFVEGRPALRFRNTLDRTLIHFRLPPAAPESGRKSENPPGMPPIPPRDR